MSGSWGEGGENWRVQGGSVAHIVWNKDKQDAPSISNEQDSFSKTIDKKKKIVTITIITDDVVECAVSCFHLIIYYYKQKINTLLNGTKKSTLIFNVYWINFNLRRSLIRLPVFIFQKLHQMMKIQKELQWTISARSSFLSSFLCLFFAWFYF